MNYSGNKILQMIKKNEKECHPDDEVNNNQSCMNYNTNKVFEVKPFPKFVIKNFEFDKLYKEKIYIKNLMEFPIVLNVKSSDSKKLEINYIGNSIKLSQFQTISLEISIRVEKKIIKIPSDKIKLFINFTSELLSVKYYVELELPKKENNSNINKNSLSTNGLNHPYFSSTPIIRTTQQIDKNQINKIITNKHEILKISEIKDQNEFKEYVEDNVINLSLGVIKDDFKRNEYEISNFNFHFSDSLNFMDYRKENERLERENEYLKEKLESYVWKLKEMEELIQTFSQFVESSSKSNENNLYLVQQTIHDFVINSEKLNYSESKNDNVMNYDKNREVNDFNVKSLSFHGDENFILTTHKSSKLKENGRKIPKINNLSEKTSKLERDLKLHLSYSDSQVYEVESENIINSKLYLEKHEEKERQENTPKIHKFDFSHINDKFINSLKERFIQIEVSELNEKKNRFKEISRIFKNLLKLASTLQSIPFSNSSPQKSKSLSDQINEIEKLLKNFLSNLNNYSESVLNSEFIEDQLLKRLGIISQDPILSNDELDYLYEEIQNVTMITQEMERAKFQAEKLNYENQILRNENDKIRCLNQEILDYSKRLENDLDLYKKEILQKEDLTKLKQRMLERLQNEIDEIRNSCERPRKYINESFYCKENDKEKNKYGIITE